MLELEAAHESLTAFALAPFAYSIISFRRAEFWISAPSHDE